MLSWGPLICRYVDMIARKSDYVALWHKGLLGNKLRSWDSLSEIPPGFQKVMVRQKSRNGGGGMAREALIRDLPVWPIKSPGNYFFNELAPDEKVTLQGEVVECCGLELFAHCRGPEETGMLRMRDILRKARRYRGLIALHLLRELLDLYPGHVIELSAYSMNLGHCEGRNTIIWEVRAY